MNITSKMTHIWCVLHLTMTVQRAHTNIKSRNKDKRLSVIFSKPETTESIGSFSNDDCDGILAQLWLSAIDLFTFYNVVKVRYNWISVRAVKLKTALNIYFKCSSCHQNGRCGTSFLLCRGRHGLHRSRQICEMTTSHVCWEHEHSREVSKS